MYVVAALGWPGFSCQIEPGSTSGFCGRMRWLAALLIWALAAGQALAGNGAHITGTASYRERMALPPGAELVFQPGRRMRLLYRP